MDKLETLKAITSSVLKFAGLQTPQGLGFPCIATFEFTFNNHAASMAATRAGRKQTPWKYDGKNYRVTGIKITGKYLEIYGYPIDIPRIAR